MSADNQIVKSYLPGEPAGTGEFQEELVNQQLNDALSAGTIDGILMKSGYSSVYDHHVVVRKELSDYVTYTNLQSEINNTLVYDFGDYTSNKKLYVKSNANPLSQSIPTMSHITRRGEIAVDNYDGSLYLLGSEGTVVQKVDAGTINGHVVEVDVLASDYLDQQAIKDLINSAFDYDSVTNTLTIKTV